MSVSARVQGLWRPEPAAVAAAEPQPAQAETDPDWARELEAALVQALAAVVRDQRDVVQPLQVLAPVRGSEEQVLSSVPRTLIEGCMARRGGTSLSIIVWKHKFLS